MTGFGKIWAAVWHYESALADRWWRELKGSLAEHVGKRLLGVAVAAAGMALLGHSMDGTSGALLGLVLLTVVLLLWTRTTAQAAIHAEHEALKNREMAQCESRIRELEDEVGRWRTDFLYAFTRDHLQRRYGEASRRRPVDKLQPLKTLFEARADEIERGDFSRAAEVVDILRYYEPMVERWQEGKAAYEPTMERIQRIETAVEQYFATVPRQAAGPPQSTMHATAPPSSPE